MTPPAPGSRTRWFMLALLFHARNAMYMQSQAIAPLLFSAGLITATVIAYSGYLTLRRAQQRAAT